MQISFYKETAKRLGDALLKRRRASWVAAQLALNESIDCVPMNLFYTALN